MKREIKFRGLRKDGKGWAYGNLLQFKGTAKIQLQEDVDPYVFEVHPETVGQFTGMLDRNGKEIYEGDKHSDGGVVIWNSDDASFCWKWEGLETASMDGESKWAEITGNIHER